MSASTSMSPSLLQTVIFDPLSYIHPVHFMLPTTFDNAMQHAIINRMLIDHYQLCSELPVIASGSRDQVFLKYWSQLPQLAYLLACQRFRVALSRGGKLLNLPHWARSFAMLPLPLSNDTPMSVGVLNTTTLLKYGLTDLLSHCRGLTPTMRQRLPLLFPFIVKTKTTMLPAPLPILAPAAKAGSGDILFTLALQHVKKIPGKTALPPD
ncbi:type III secretion apparatus protein OrgA/MxiK [Glaciimonas sp. PCH181]|uniref:type III secretion apparatus protein OrgA/MxiK n=1 Tax=Glaciimonas sp. PCH181 TaxID=2133943 RepID=UPI001374A30A|nr:type III secretion apparatus protein OrgA/MxiK [Glaciimonas sp. PCH181]